MAIFVSYARADSVAVQALIKDLDRTDHRPWMDGQLRGGDAWWNEILRQIRECDVFVFALSEHSLHSRPCQAELDYARRLGVPIIPLQVGPVSTMRAGPFADVQVIDYTHPNSTTGMELVAAIERLIRTRGPLPDPEATPPGVPFAYLMRLRNEIDAPTLSAEDQERILGDLTRAFEQEEAAVRPDIIELMHELKSRPDVTHRVANQIDRTLTPVGAPAGGAGSTTSQQSPWQAPPRGGAGGGWAGPPAGGAPGYQVPPPRGSTPPPGPPGPPFTAPPAPPPQRGGRRTVWIVLAVVAVLVVVAAALLVMALGKGSDSTGGTATGGSGGTTTTGATSTGGSVTMQITDSLDPSWESFEIVTVTSQGQKVGSLEVSQASKDATLMVTAEYGQAPYELDVQYFDLDGNQGSCVGTGTVDATDGATFAVVAQQVGSSCAASLEQR